MAVNQAKKFESQGSTTITLTSSGAGGSLAISAPESGLIELAEELFTGTENQVTVTITDEAITFSTPQNTDTGATPQFARLGLGTAAHASLAINAVRGALIDGSSDEVQLKVQGHATQTSNLLELEDSGANDQVTISNDGAAVFNEEGNAADFRVESDGDANCLHVNGTNNTVQIGAASASDSAKFYVNGKVSGSGEFEINGDLNHDGSNAGFYGVTPAARPSALTQTYSTADRTHAARSASSLTDNTGGTAGTTIAAIADPADTPLTADALRDDLVANALPAIRNAVASLAAQVNNLKTDVDDTAQFLNSAVDDLQSLGLEQ